MNSLTRVIDHNNGVQTSYRQTNFGSTECRISYCVDYAFVAKCRTETKEDKVNTDGTVQDLQVTNLFLSMCGQDAIIKLRSLMSPRNLRDTPYKDIRLALQNYISPKESSNGRKSQISVRNTSCRRVRRRLPSTS